MHNHVTNKEISEKLKALGVRQESEFYWNKDYSGKDFILDKYSAMYPFENRISTFLASELMEMLRNVTLWKDGSTYRTHDCINDTEASTPQDALALMLIYLIEHKLIEN